MGSFKRTAEAGKPYDCNLKLYKHRFIFFANIHYLFLLNYMVNVKNILFKGQFFD